MLRTWGIANDRTTVQGLPGRSAEMDAHDIPFISVARKQYRVRHGFRVGAHWAGVLLNALALSSQEQDVSRRDLQNIRDIPAFIPLCEDRADGKHGRSCQCQVLYEGSASQAALARAARLLV